MEDRIYHLFSNCLPRMLKYSQGKRKAVPLFLGTPWTELEGEVYIDAVLGRCLLFRQ
jgi:hypothetical protein